MGELHDAIGPMGNLTSYNVLVDRRWTCRISDYGLDKFREPNPAFIPTLSEDETYKSKLTLYFQRNFSFPLCEVTFITVPCYTKLKQDGI